jgi:hypothetical protein
MKHLTFLEFIVTKITRKKFLEFTAMEITGKKLKDCSLKAKTFFRFQVVVFSLCRKLFSIIFIFAD